MPQDGHARRVLGLLAQKGMLRPSDLEAIKAPRML